jgi:glycosyltransferase involved in cell wall biosynthesis
MKSTPRVSLIVAVYKRVDFLRLILEALERQTERDFEVIIAEDCRDRHTGSLVIEFKGRGVLDIAHVSQDDIGFRKNKILNAAIKESRGEILAFLDGDCVPHRRFIEAYARYIQPGFAYWGRRVMLGSKITGKLMRAELKFPLGFLSLLFSDSRRIEEGIFLPLAYSANKMRALSGCNWGIFKKHLVAINGFDEDYVSACVGEDCDVEERLIISGVGLKNVRNKAIVYHLNHGPNYDAASHFSNMEMMRRNIGMNGAICKNGLNPISAHSPINAEKTDRAVCTA